MEGLIDVTDVPGLWDVCRAVLDRPDARFGLLLEEIVSWLPADVLTLLVAEAVAGLHERPALFGVVEQTALQLPELLTPHLRRLWDVDPNPRSYTRELPWRGADGAEVKRLLDAADAGAERGRVARCLLQAGAWDTVRDRNLIPDSAAWTWETVGSSASGRSLVSGRPHHLAVAEDLLPPRAAWRRRRHATWELTAPKDVPIGGGSDAVCAEHGPFRRLLLLEPPPLDCVAGARARLDLAYCGGCADQVDATFHVHDAQGRPRMLPREPLQEYFEYGELPAMPAGLVETPARWATQDWGLSNGRENLNRVGGAPCWIQAPQYEPCPGCGEQMPFLAQLDWSSLADDDGITYLLWCDTCSISAMVFQTT